MEQSTLIPRQRKLASTGLFWLWVSILIIPLDRITKYYALHLLDPYSPLPLFPGFNFTLAYNKGAAFSFLGSASGWQGWLLGSVALGVCLVLLIWLFRLPRSQRWLSIAITLIIGGALGNLTDRFLYGHVIDFIDVYYQQWHWPVFNIADSAICIGAGMLLIEALFKRK